MKKISFLMIASAVLIIPALLTAKTYSLEECIDISIQESEKIKALDEGEKAAKSGKDSVIFSFLPTAKIDAAYQWLKFDPEPEPTVLDLTPLGLAPVEFGAIPDKSRTVSLTAVQPVTPLWSVSFGYKIAETGHSIAKMQKELTKDQIRLEVITLYYNYQMLSESMTILSETKEQLKRYNAQATNFVNAGLSDKRAVLKIEIEQAKLDQQIQIIEGNVSLIKKNLSIFMNTSVSDLELENVKTSETTLSANHDELESLMLKNRIELKMLQKSISISEYQKMLAVQPFIPSFVLVAGYKKTWDSSQFQPENTFFFGGTISWDIGFDWGKSAFELKKANHEKVKTALDNANTKKLFDLQLIQLENDIAIKSGAIEIAKKEVVSATENLRIEEDKYREKLTTETELLDASISFRSAKMKLLNSIWEHEVALNRLAITIGSKYSDIAGGGN